MAVEINRGKLILKNWADRQRELELLGGKEGDLSSGIKREKYIFLRAGLARLEDEPTMDERIYARMIGLMLKKLEKDFFPNPIIRKYMHWKVRLMIMPGLVRYFNELRARNFDELDKRITSMGFKGLSGYLKSQLDFERAQIELPVSSRFEQNGAMEVTLRFEKNFDQYQLSTMEVTLLLPGEPERKCSIPDRYGLNVNQAAALLNGGTVRLETVQGRDEEKWVQLDFDHLDESGRFQLREHVLEKDFSLESIISGAAIDLAYPALGHPVVMDTLKNGGQVVFSPENAEIFYLQANPGARSLLFRDSNQKIISFSQLRESLTKRMLKVDDQKLSVKKFGFTKNREQNQGVVI